MSDSTSTTRRTTLKGLAAGAFWLAADRALAQDDKAAITVLVGAASSMDFTARMIADQLTESLGRPAITLSKLGAGQRIALAEARHAAPDGRTLLFATNGPFCIYPHIYTRLDYDPDRDFTPIAGVSNFDVAVATGPATGAQDMKQMIAWAKAKGKDAVFGSAPGNGSLSQFFGISISLATHTPMEHVPYKDSGVGIIDLAAGRLPMMITGLQPLVEMHKNGKIRILAVSGEQRSPLVPEVPTLKETGINLSSSTTTGLFGPARMSPKLVATLHDALAPMFTKPATLEKMRQQGMTPAYTDGKTLAASLVSERKHFGMLVKASGYVPQET
ncbi:Bug family tripartite tricarboxylate transporter substrate binding protein [Variovorax sp. PBL-E5]|uniref:Bug family tripartite tricarboxylate transporter substrate binding protein n=1 Tax=Variovorax sp. PBL-E5 TaxID=434014 RepID=UPI00131694A2|nr:tripartite tricarboxylate transporter substrate-binding protein [Variovorax sp. PBL-E5]VTU26023.1 Argininosuccinate lyase [Variovorax sp. PBL-E5]